MKKILITGANRGIGLAFVRHYAAQGWRVSAACRSPEQAVALTAVEGDVQVRPLDVTDEAQMKRLASEIDSLDLLIHNAGIFAAGEEGLASIESERMLQVFRVNVLGPILLTQHLAPALNSGSCVAALTSGAGLLRAGAGSPGGQYSYGLTKAALARALHSLADDLRPQNVSVIGLNPGFVRTDMTQGSAVLPPLSPDESVAGLTAVLHRITLEQTGRFFNHDGSEAAWFIPS